MKFFYRFFRLMRINFILIRYNIDDLIFGSQRFYPLHFLVYFNPFYWLLRNKYPRAVRLRLAIEKLGPIFVKAGQLMSTRQDILPPDILRELAKLQDKVPPYPGKIAQAIIETSLESPLNSIFSYFDIIPLASASIAQVHSATLLSGESVIVKVLRPNIQAIIEQDIDLLLILAKIANAFWYTAQRFKPIELINEVAQTLRDELDLMREAANASQLKRNSASITYLHIPKVYWQYSCSTVLTMERIHGISIHHFTELKARGYDFKLLAQRAIEIFFTQIFRDNFFHADLHPGNIFVSEDPHNPIYILVDFGIVASLSQEDQRYIAENMIAFFKRNYQRVAELHLASGWLPPDTRIDLFEGAIRAVSEPILEQPLMQVSFAQLLLRLFQVARRFNINIQPQLILLQKTLLNIEGLCRSLSPEIDLWSLATPQIEKWMKQQVGFKALIKKVRTQLPYWSEQFPEIPTLFYEILKETKAEKERNRFAFARNFKRERRGRLLSRLSYFMMGALMAMMVMSLIVYWG